MPQTPPKESAWGKPKQVSTPSRHSLANLLITGGAGYIGSVCVEQLLDAGHTVTVFDNLTEGHRSAVDPRAL